MEKLANGICFSRFAVGEEPFCVWEWDLPERNLRFIRSLSPEYFDHLADAHFGETEDGKSKIAAVAIRLGYGQALEAFFALVCATLQAPDCVAGWLCKYKAFRLQQLVRDISADRPLLSKFKLPSFSWEAIADLLIPIDLEDKALEHSVKKGFGRLWARFALDFADEDQEHEYNCIKHGLRIQPGGFQLRHGLEEFPGAPVPSEKMHFLGGSEFGSTMLRPESVGLTKEHFRLRRYSRNWQVENLARGLGLLAHSMRNVASFLQLANRADPKTIRFWYPDNLKDFDEPWLRSVSATSINMDLIVRAEHAKQFSREEISGVYGPAKEDSANHPEPSGAPLEGD